jgi:hypothetical protein
MAIIRRTKTEDYVVVHHVYGEQPVIDFLRMTSRKIISRLFFDARSYGTADFSYRDMPYRITFTNKDLYEIDKIEEDIRDIY